MVEQLQEEKETSGFNYTPTQEFPEVGDQYDRDIGYVDGLPTRRNIGWDNFTPSQRYSMIIVAYAAVLDAVVDGQVGQLSDEVIMIAAIAPYDLEAKEAGEAFARSEEYSAIKPLHELLYGSSDLGGAMAEHGFPQIDTDNPQRTFDGLYTALGGLPPSIVSQPHPLAPGGVYGQLSGAGWNQPRSPYAEDSRGVIMTSISEAVHGKPEASASDLFKYVGENVATEANTPKSAFIENIGFKVAPIIADATLTVGLGGMGAMALSKPVMVLGSIVKNTSMGAPIAARIVDGVRVVKVLLGGNSGRYIRRGVQAAGGIMSAGVMGSAALRAAFENNTESIEALLADTTDPQARDTLSKIYYEMDHPVSYTLRNDPKSWWNQREERAKVTPEDARQAAAMSRYGSDDYQAGPQELREGYSFFNPEVRQARKETTVEEMEDIPAYDVKMYETANGWELR